ncbi:hypothetical protein [Klebsiella pneumoniae]|uniref:hypothetical protein n=1 Tax=Klebsiella pneumoniae TaxID=573 RepID=UPI001D0D9760|nr:hypothetical protein [Klebsiella pneumoniae]
MALQTNTVTSSATLTLVTQKMASECKDKEEIKAVREKQQRTERYEQIIRGWI